MKGKRRDLPRLSGTVRGKTHSGEETCPGALSTIGTGVATAGLDDFRFRVAKGCFGSKDCIFNDLQLSPSPSGNVLRGLELFPRSLGGVARGLGRVTSRINCLPRGLGHFLSLAGRVPQGAEGAADPVGEGKNDPARISCVSKQGAQDEWEPGRV